MRKWQIVMTDTAKSDLREIALGIYEISRDPETAVNFVMELETNDYEARRGNQRLWAVVEKEDALMLADYLKVKLTALPKVFNEKFGESGAFVLSYVEARFREILDFILDCGIHYQLITK